MLPRWAPCILSFKNVLQKLTGDVMDTTSICFTVYNLEACISSEPMLLLFRFVGYIGKMVKDNHSCRQF